MLFDFSDTEEFNDIVAVKNTILAKKETGVPITGIIAVNMADLDHDRIRLLSEGIAKIIISTGKDTTISFAHPTFPPEAISVVPQATIDDVVKKLLEPVILSILEKPISGFDIVHEIHNRYKVLIPQARIYTYLYDLQGNGYLEMKVSGKSKLYSPTEAGKKYIRQRLNEFKFVFRAYHGRGIRDSRKKRMIFFWFFTPSRGPSRSPVAGHRIPDEPPSQKPGPPAKSFQILKHILKFPNMYLPYEERKDVRWGCSPVMGRIGKAARKKSCRPLPGGGARMPVWRIFLKKPGEGPYSTTFPSDRTATGYRKGARVPRTTGPSFAIGIPGPPDNHISSSYFQEVREKHEWDKETTKTRKIRYRSTRRDLQKRNIDLCRMPAPRCS